MAVVKIPLSGKDAHWLEGNMETFISCFAEDLWKTRARTIGESILKGFPVEQRDAAWLGRGLIEHTERFRAPATARRLGEFIFRHGN